MGKSRTRSAGTAGCGLLLVAALLGAESARAAENPAAATRPADGAGADELALFADLPVVVSSSRQAQPINLSAAPVSVVTAEDIHYSGLTNVAEVLQFVPGVDVLRLDRNRYAVGVRGLHDTFSDRTLVLVNGRAAESPFFGGPEFDRLPLLMEDIARIEVVRGPGGAAWGANAFNGVINIITRRPEDVQGVLASTTVNEFGDTYSQVRWGAQAGPWVWRVSGGYESRESSEEAIDGDAFTSRDFARNWRFDGEAAYRFDPHTRLSFGLGYAHQDRGDWAFFRYYPPANEELDTTRLFARVDRELEDGGSAYLQWFGNFEDTDRPSLARSFTAVNDLEAQVNLQASKEHRVSVGGNLRWIYFNDEGGGDPNLLHVAGDPLQEYWAGLFVIDRWRLTGRLTWENQIRGDYYSQTGPDWSGRTALLYDLDGEQKHIVRLSGARAFRAPLITLREALGARYFPPPVPPGIVAGSVRPGGDLENERLWSLEAGYTGRLTPELTLRLDGYWQRYEDMIGYLKTRTASPAPLPAATHYIPINQGGAQAWGGEAELVWRVASLQVSGWYAYNGFQPARYEQHLRAFLPSKHKVGGTARWHLPDQWTLQAQYRYLAHTEAHYGMGQDVQDSHRLDLTVSKRFWKNRAEVMVGVTDLMDRTLVPAAGQGDDDAHETPGRTFFGRVQISF